MVPSTAQAADAASAPAPWQIRLSTLLWAGLLTLLVCSLPVLIGASWLSLPALLLTAAILALPAAWLHRRLWKKSRTRPWRGAWLRASLGIFCLLCGVLALPVYYLAIATEARPASVPTVTLTNGPRTLVLQGMQHVALERFYKSVVYDLEQALADGYVLAYEGVAKSDPLSDAWFDKTLAGGQELGDRYRQLGKLCGLGYQIDYMGPLVADAKLRPQRHVTLDVDTRAMKQQYDRLMASDATFAAAMQRREREADKEASDGSADVIARIIDWQKSGSSSQIALAGTLCRGVMTHVMRRANAHQPGEPLDAVVLDMRNRHLASALMADPRPKIYVTYGAAHLPGVIALLQQQAGWQLQSVKWMRTIAAPDTVTGTL